MKLFTGGNYTSSFTEKGGSFFHPTPHQHPRGVPEKTITIDLFLGKNFQFQKIQNY